MIVGWSQESFNNTRVIGEDDEAMGILVEPADGKYTFDG